MKLDYLIPDARVVPIRTVGVLCTSDVEPGETEIPVDVDLDALGAALNSIKDLMGL